MQTTNILASAIPISKGALLKFLMIHIPQNTRGKSWIVAFQHKDHVHHPPRSLPPTQKKGIFFTPVPIGHKAQQII